jgi:hypothetical protein
VIKTGVKMISLSYSKISLANIAEKLQLDSAVDAEFIVAKAIRDGVIEAHIDHESGYVQTKDLTDIYSTLEPMKAFNQRIKFCLDLRNQSVKAMRFPPKKYSEELETAEVRKINFWEFCFINFMFFKRNDVQEKKKSLSMLRKWLMKKMMVLLRLLLLYIF